MKKISITEFGRIKRSEINQKALKRLQKFDERHANSSHQFIFDWSHVTYLRAQNYVGVIQIPGLLIEILPKIDTSPIEKFYKFNGEDPLFVNAQHNLLYMLSFTKKIPIRERDLASLRLQKMPLLEALASIFVEKLLREIRKGLDHSYVYREENSPYFKGKLLINKHIAHNIVHQEKVYIGYNEFLADTWLNRILKAACLKLLTMVETVRIQKRLREALLYFTDISKKNIQNHHFKKVTFTRNNRRFETLFDFSKAILLDSSPSPSKGKDKTFSLLFPMETLFEDFIAKFIKKYCHDFNLSSQSIHIQALKKGKWLLRKSDNSGAFRLKPDLIIDSEDKTPQLILDTKWKHLKTDQEDSKNGVSQADLYQLYAYANRYNSPDNILLYPKIDGVTPKRYSLDGKFNKNIRIEFINLNFNLSKNRAAFLNELKSIIDTNI